MHRILLHFTIIFFFSSSGFSQGVSLSYGSALVCDDESTVSIPLLINYAGAISAYDVTTQIDLSGLESPTYTVNPEFDIPGTFVSLTGLNGNAFSISTIHPDSVSITPGDTLGILQLEIKGVTGDFSVDINPNPPSPLFPAEVADFQGLPITPFSVGSQGLVTVLDRVPTFQNCPGNLVFGTSNGQCDGVANWAVPSVLDCDGNDNSPTNNFNPGSTFQIGSTDILYEVSDSDGNLGTCTFSVSIIDDESPIISCTGDTTLTIFTGSGPAELPSSFFEPSSTDNCSINQTSYEYELSGASSGSGIFDLNTDYEFNPGVTQVSLTVSDDGGNSASCASSVTILEENLDSVSLNINPVISDCNEDTVTIPVTILHEFFISSYNFALEWSNELEFISYEDIIPTGGSPLINQIGNTLIVGNTFFPSVTLNAGDTLFYLRLLLPPGASPGDTYSVELSQSLGVNHLFGDDDLIDIPIHLNPGLISVDADDPPVILSCPQDITIDCGSSLDTADTGSPVANDDCSDNLTITVSDGLSAGCGLSGEILRTFTVEDEAGQTVECEQIITVIDTLIPVAVCAEDVTVFLDDTGNAMLTPQDVDGGSTDECGGTTATQVTPNAFDCSHIGTGQTVVLSVEDDCGNLDTCQASITVADTIPPVPACLDITVEVDAMGGVSIAPADLLDEANSTDNCTDVTADALDMPDLTCDQLGDNDLVLTVSDEYANTATCTGTVTVEDNIDPIAGCVDITVELDSGGKVIVNQFDVFDASTSSDNCGVVVAQSLANGFLNCSNVGDNTVILTVEDGSDNSGTCEATVTVLDVISPTVVCEDITLSLDVLGSVSLQPAAIFDASNSSDNCVSVAADSVSPRIFGCEDVGSPITVTLFASDDNGNTSTCTSMVTIIDVDAPTISCNNLVLDSLGPAGITINPNDFVDGISSTDNCTDIDDFVILQPGLTTFTCADVAMSPLTITVQVADESGNTTFCESTVDVLDTEAPVAECKDVTLNVPLTGITLLPNQVDNGSTDNCGIDMMTVSPNVFTCDDIMVDNGGIPLQAELTVFDQSGNRDTCLAGVTLISTVQPSVVCQDFTVYLDEFGMASITPEDIFDENESISCGELTPSILSPTNFDCGDIFSPQTVLLNAIDPSGNIGACTALVIVLDTISPDAVCTRW